jgi:hypothetical protein
MKPGMPLCLTISSRGNRSGKALAARLDEKPVTLAGKAGAGAPALPAGAYLRAWWDAMALSEACWGSRSTSGRRLTTAHH